MISTQNLSALPDVPTRRLLQSLAMLDAIICRSWDSRLYSFNSRWSAGKTMGSMRNGQGDDFFAEFSDRGCILLGFDHTAPMTPYRKKKKAPWPGLFDRVPSAFNEALSQPAFSPSETTFCIWRETDDDRWHRGDIAFPEGHPDPDGSAYLLSPLDGNPQTYRDRAAIHFSKPHLTVEMVRHVYEHRPLTDELLAAMRGEIAADDEGEPATLTVGDVEEDMREIGYPG